MDGTPLPLPTAPQGPGAVLDALGSARISLLMGISTPAEQLCMPETGGRRAG